MHMRQLKTMEVIMVLKLVAGSTLDYISQSLLTIID